MPLSASDRAAMFESCQVLTPRVTAVQSIVNKILAHRAQYEAIAAAVRFPWYAIAAIHNRESSLDFTTHLHNGDPLSARTYHVPAGRPKTGEPPFTFVESAIDALTYEGYAGLGEPTIGKLLALMEQYNGTGYTNMGKPSPYLWSFTNKYSAGKYVADGVYNASAVDAQCGIVPILLYLHQSGAITLRGEAVPVKVGATVSKTARAFVIRGNSWVSVRDAAALLGFEITSTAPLTIEHTGKSHAMPIRVAGTPGVGFVDASDLCAFLGRKIKMSDGALVIS